MKKIVHHFARTFIPRLPVWVRRRLVMAGRDAVVGLKEFRPYPNLESSLLNLQEKGFRPSFAVDVGAFRGEWTEGFKKIFPPCRILMVEAHENKKAPLTALASGFGGTVSLATAVLGAADDVSVAFHESENASSVFREQGTPIDRSTTRTLTRLDSLLEQRGETGAIDFLKLDTQGYELEVLKGAPRALERAEIVLLEASLIPINAGCPLALEVLNFMGERGFRWVDLCEQWRRPDGMLWQMDFLFMKETSPLLPVPPRDGSPLAG